MQKKKPLINVSHDVMTRRSYTLTDAAAKMLESYAFFLSDHMNFRVSVGDILSKLVLKLSKDKVYMEWLRQRDLTSNRGGTAAVAPEPGIGD
jgi:hypothetical protein